MVRVPETFGELLRSLRLQSGESLDRFSLRIGVRARYLGAVERGNTLVSVSTARKWADLLGVPEDVRLRFKLDLRTCSECCKALLDDGTMPDGLLARRFGLTVMSVTQYRRKAQIPSWARESLDTPHPLTEVHYLQIGSKGNG